MKSNRRGPQVPKEPRKALAAAVAAAKPTLEFTPVEESVEEGDTEMESVRMQLMAINDQVAKLQAEMGRLADRLQRVESKVR